MTAKEKAVRSLISIRQRTNEQKVADAILAIVQFQTQALMAESEAEEKLALAAAFRIRVDELTEMITALTPAPVTETLQQ